MISLTSPYTFFVPGVPRSSQTGSVVRAGHRLIPLRRGTAWSATFGLLALQHKPSRPLAGAVRVSMAFQFHRPASAKKRARPTVRPDVENLCKGLLDSLNGVFWADDAQVTSLELHKVYADPVGVSVMIWEIN